MLEDCRKVSIISGCRVTDRLSTTPALEMYNISDAIIESHALDWDRGVHKSMRPQRSMGTRNALYYVCEVTKSSQLR